MIKTRYLSTAVVGLGLLVALPAEATIPSLPFGPISCKTLNAANIGITADENGYTTTMPTSAYAGSVAISYTDGDYNWTSGYGSIKVPLPENGIICLRSFNGTPSVTSSSDPAMSYARHMSFIRNTRNTPVYFIVETTIVMNYTEMSVAGQDGDTYSAAGMTHRGGLGGPAGSDGGSCDYSDVNTPRRGDGLGPGGGRGGGLGLGGGRGGQGASYGGGGGASPIQDGEPAYNTGDGEGTHVSTFDQRLITGGSGGGCGENGGGTKYAGGGGGGVLVVLAGTSIDTGTNGCVSYACGFTAEGGGAGNNGGGCGGGGVIRLISPTIKGYGVLDVRGGSATYNGTNYTGQYNRYSTLPGSTPTFYCNRAGAPNSSYPGGCGGNGVIKLEGYDVQGQFLYSAKTLNGIDSLKFGTPQAAYITTVPKVEVIDVEATFDGNVVNQSPPPLDFTRHPLTQPGMYFRPSQTLTVTIETTDVPPASTLWVRMNAMDDDAAWAPMYSIDGSVTAPTLVAGTKYDWTLTVTVPASTKLGAIEAWVDSVPTP